MDWKKVVLYAIIPAIIAGLFSVAPKLYDEFTTPRAEIIYRLTSGPAIRIAKNDFQQIYSIEIANIGKVALDQITGQLSIPRGSIETFAIEDTQALNPKIKTDSSSASIELDRLLPAETIRFSILLLIPDRSIRPKIVLRSQQVLGEEQIDNPEKKKNDILNDVIGPLMAGVSVFAMALFFMITRFNPIKNLSAKQDIIVFIAAVTGIKEVADEVRRSESNITYLRMADILLTVGINSKDINVKNRCVTGLKCILLIQDIAETSLKVTIENIRTINVEKFTDSEYLALRQKAISINGADNFLKLRKEIGQMI